MTATYQESHILMKAYDVDEKVAAEQDDLVNSHHVPTKHDHCCSKRDVAVKRGIIALAVSLAILLGLGIFSLCCPGGPAMLLKRQSGDNGSNDTGSAFTNQHLWIIIVCVVGMLLFICLRAETDGRCAFVYCARDLYCFMLLSGCV